MTKISSISMLPFYHWPRSLCPLLCNPTRMSSPALSTDQAGEQPLHLTFLTISHSAHPYCTPNTFFSPFLFHRGDQQICHSFRQWQTMIGDSQIPLSNHLPTPPPHIKSILWTGLKMSLVYVEFLCKIWPQSAEIRSNHMRWCVFKSCIPVG